MEQQNSHNIFTLKAVWASVCAHRKTFYWALPITVVLSAGLIFSIPRYWQSTITLSPETTSGSLGSLGSLASSFGLNVESSGAEDAILPEFYPDVVKSQTFLVELFDIQIQTSDGQYAGDYYTYLTKHRRLPWWKRAKNAVKRLFYRIHPPTLGGRPGTNVNDVDPFWLTKKQSGIVTLLRKNIVCSHDKKNGMLTIHVTDQDKLVAALIADSVSAHLQAHITTYRTQKARIDVQYYQTMCDESYAIYEEAANKYIQYVDSHSDMTLERYRAEAELLMRDRDIKWAAYEGFHKQTMAASAKVQESTPAFAIISTATVSELPAGPKRIRFIAAMLLLVSISLSVWYSREYWIALLH